MSKKTRRRLRWLLFAMLFPFFGIYSLAITSSMFGDINDSKVNFVITLFTTCLVMTSFYWIYEVIKVSRKVVKKAGKKKS
jgi:hypothetical protein